MSEDDKMPSLYSLHITQIHHSNEIETIKRTMGNQQKALDEINSGIKWLNRLVFGAIIVAVLKFMLSGGFNV